MDSGLSYDASSEVYSGEDLALAAEGGRGRRTGRYISSISSFWLLEASFHTFVMDVVFFHRVSAFDTHATLSDGKCNKNNKRDRGEKKNVD